MVRTLVYQHKVTRLYTAWLNMRRRARNTIDKPCYRHVTVCPEWESSYSNFHEWALRSGYTDDKTLDRIDNLKGYSPDNCRWTDRRTQHRNRRTAKHIMAFGETKIIIEWVEDPRCAVKEKTLYYRLAQGWEPERAITTPPLAGQDKLQ